MVGTTTVSALGATNPHIFFCFASACACALDKVLTSSINVSCCAERARGECTAALHIKYGAELGRKKGMSSEGGKCNYESGRKKACIAWGKGGIDSQLQSK